MSPFGKIRVGSAKGTGPRTLPCCAISRSISCAKSPARRACPASASPVLWIPSTCSRYCWESNFNALALPLDPPALLYLTAEVILTFMLRGAAPTEASQLYPEPQHGRGPV